MENKNQQNKQDPQQQNQNRGNPSEQRKNQPGQPGQNKPGQGDRNQKQDYTNPQRTSEENVDFDEERDDTSRGNVPNRDVPKGEERYPTR